MGGAFVPHPNGITTFEGCEFEVISFELCLKTSSLWDTIGKDGTKLNLNKVKVVLEFLVPIIVTNGHAFLGLT
jgi:hypothetical protein